MIIVYGTRLCGYVDEMPDGTSIATKFAHVMYIPLFPLQTYWILSKDGNGFRGHCLPMSGKSVLAAYSRILLFFLALAAFVPGVSSLSKAPSDILSPWVDVTLEGWEVTFWRVALFAGAVAVAVGCYLLHHLSKRLLRATPERQDELVQHVLSQSQS